MTKLNAVAILSMGLLGVSAGSANAFYPRCYKSSFTYSVSCRPYNAFSPCAFGQVYYDGCVPAPGYFGAPYPAGIMAAYNPYQTGQVPPAHPWPVAGGAGYPGAAGAPGYAMPTAPGVPAGQAFVPPTAGAPTYSYPPAAASGYYNPLIPNLQQLPMPQLPISRQAPGMTTSQSAGPGN